jgi:hypothetical protein
MLELLLLLLLTLLFRRTDPFQSISAVDVNSENTILVTGDNMGYVRVWDISEYYAAEKTTRDRPRITATWRAHVQVGQGPFSCRVCTVSNCIDVLAIFVFERSYC